MPTELPETSPPDQSRQPQSVRRPSSRRSPDSFADVAAHVTHRLGDGRSGNTHRADRQKAERAPSADSTAASRDASSRPEAKQHDDTPTADASTAAAANTPEPNSQVKPADNPADGAGAQPVEDCINTASGLSTEDAAKALVAADSQLAHGAAPLTDPSEALFP